MGASLSINVIADTTDALIQDSTVTASGGDVQVTSMSAAEINSIAASLVAASGTAVSGSFTINVLNNRTRSLISGANTSVTADGNVWLDANDRGNVVAVSGGVALGGFLKNKETDEESAGGAIPTIGLSNSTVVTSNLVEASIATGVDVQANANQPAVAAFAGEFNSSGNRVLEAARGVIVTADSYDNIISIAAGGAVNANGQRTAAIAGSATVTVIDDTTRASIDADNVNTASTGESNNQSVIVRAAAVSYTHLTLPTIYSV